MFHPFLSTLTSTYKQSYWCKVIITLNVRDDLDNFSNHQKFNKVAKIQKYIEYLNGSNDVDAYGNNFYHENVFHNKLMNLMEYTPSTHTLIHIYTMPYIVAIIIK